MDEYAGIITRGTQQVNLKGFSFLNLHSEMLTIIEILAEKKYVCIGIFPVYFF